MSQQQQQEVEEATECSSPSSSSSSSSSSQSSSSCMRTQSSPSSFRVTSMANPLPPPPQVRLIVETECVVCRTKTTTTCSLCHHIAYCSKPCLVKDKENHIQICKASRLLDLKLTDNAVVTCLQKHIDILEPLWLKAFEDKETHASTYKESLFYIDSSTPQTAKLCQLHQCIDTTRINKEELEVISGFINSTTKTELVILMFDSVDGYTYVVSRLDL